jgi:hypothetical protein
MENLWKAYGKPAETYGKPNGSLDSREILRNWSEISRKFAGPSSMVSFHDSTIKNVDLTTTTWDSTKHLEFFSTWDFWIYHD